MKRKADKFCSTCGRLQECDALGKSCLHFAKYLIRIKNNVTL